MKFRRLLVGLLLKFRPVKFKKWIELEDQKTRIRKAHKESREEFPKLVIHFLSHALSVPEKQINQLYWAETMSLFNRVALSITFTDYLPLASLAPKVDDEVGRNPWEYEGRTWHFYSHMLAKAYGWSLEYIADLPIFEAMAKVEEILLDEQLQREFQWGMSEASVIYDSKSQTSKPNPLPRPYWMKTANPTDPLPIKKVRIPSHMLPVGAVSYDAVTDEYKPKEITTK
jgi:hypothetical protein